MDKKAFGNRIANNFNVGDMVNWSDWSDSNDGVLNRKLSCGILINIITKQLGERDVVFGQILPLKSKEIVEIVITNITKVETTY